MNWYRVEYYVADRYPSQTYYVYMQAHSAADALVSEETSKSSRGFRSSRLVAIDCVEKPPTIAERTECEEVREDHRFLYRNKSSTQF